jgi:hypothetical protein
LWTLWIMNAPPRVGIEGGVCESPHFAIGSANRSSLTNATSLSKRGETQQTHNNGATGDVRDPTPVGCTVLTNHEFLPLLIKGERVQRIGDCDKNVRPLIDQIRFGRAGAVAGARMPQRLPVPPSRPTPALKEGENDTFNPSDL